MSLSTLLADGRKFSSEYGDRMANHLPMSLIALERLGADESRLRAFADHYSRILTSKPAVERALIEFFDARIAEAGRDETLRTTLPTLARAIGSGAFHGVLRVAYGVEASDEAEVAEGLAYWVANWADLGREVSGRSLGVAEAFDAIRADARFAEGRVTGPSITARLDIVANTPAFADYRHAMTSPSLRELARVALAVYLASRDFTALHLVTGCHAARVLGPWLGENAGRELATAMLAAYVTIGRPAFDLASVEEPATVSWDAIAAAAIASNDDHVSKFVFSCREEQRAYGWPGYQTAAAAKAIG